MRGSVLAVLATGVVAVAFVLGAVAAPLVADVAPRAGALLQSVYAPVCHQMPSRSLELGQGNLAVCARCTGLYLGGVAGLFVGGVFLVGRGRRLHALWLAVALAPTLLDAATPWLGMSGLANVPRLVLALPAGLVAGLLLALALGDLYKSFALSPEAFTRQGSLENLDG
ncbi:MAG: DUF2085 domain-containing protein [bacterium]|nr:DUF2085 domain-containing protein [bacterium]